VTLVPINVSGKFDIPAAVGEALSQGDTLLHEYLWAVLGPLRSYYSVVFGAEVCPIHDPLAVLVALAPQHFELMRASVEIELKGELTRGTTVVDLRPEAELTNQESRTQIVQGVDAAKAWAEIAEVLGLATVSQAV
jgi:purine nucleosidase